MKVIDVSHHQGIIDWEKVKADGVKGAIIRVSDSVGIMDRQCNRNMAECERLGIPYGLYIYSRAASDAVLKREAALIVSKAKGHPIQYPLYIDIEQPGTRNYAKRAAQYFGSLVKKEGYWCGIYANLNWWNTYLTGVDQFTKWVARYGEKPSVNHLDMWQYTSAGKISGISGYCDINECYRDFPAEIGGGSSGGDGDGSSGGGSDAAPKGTVLQLAEQVMKGEFGEGEDRKKKLGVRYTEVQDLINHIASADTGTLADEAIRGEYGDGTLRKTLLKDRYEEVQREVNRKLSSAASSQAQYYTIKSGDTLSGIAKKYGTTSAKLAQLNGIRDTNKIYAGTKIRIK